jgi:hypothetical protein
VVQCLPSKCGTLSSNPNTAKREREREKERERERERRKRKEKKYWQGSKVVEETLKLCWWECKLEQPLWKSVWRVLKTLKPTV